MMDGRRFDVVLFDLGNTLLYFNGDWTPILLEMDRALLAVLWERRYDLKETDFIADYSLRWLEYDRRRIADHSESSAASVLRDSLRQFGYLDPPAEDIRAALAASYAVSQAHWFLEADAQLMLEILQKEGYRLGLVSNASDAEDVYTLVDRSQLTPYFEQIVISAIQGIRKPDPRIFKPVFDHFQVAPDRMAMVGDTLSADILGARNVGIHSIWITRRADRPDNRAVMDTIKPDAMIRTLAELPALLTQPGLFPVKQPA